ncbi:unnamed protein product [Darwinula stevensoni]|uniref:NFX1-type zinc finger-containing protein 1 n=1 Tax=Darwinula stevensoni TaxID=69355 RepID=A0A7R9A4F2_9CRUS|nr:unnamed protein product [Darwinula stevensoni]CAG0889864.1 unnamed protein product [Darwinula stevensoni]
MDTNESFRRLLSDPVTFQKSDWVVLIAGVFAKVCSVDGCDNHVNASLTMLMQSEFLEACSSRVLLELQSQPSKNEEGFHLLKQLFLILRALVTKYPGVSGSNVMKLIHACSNNLLYLQNHGFAVEELHGKFSKLLTIVQEASMAMQVGSGSTTLRTGAEEERLNRLHLTVAPENFRCIPIVPTSEELLDGEASFLRPNITKGAYANVEHYLDVHFRLQREDFVAPLRNGLKEYLNERHRKMHFKHQDIRVYTGVTYHHMEHDNGFHLIYRFDATWFSKVKWEISKRFKMGSLLCFSDFSFNQLTFGTVSRRDPNALKNGLLTIIPQSDVFDTKAWMLGEKVIIEASSAYFEAYRYVLSCLQECREDDFPLIDYIVYGTMKDAPPKFLPVQYDFSFIHPCLGKVDLLDKENWPAAEDFGFDKSQLEAFHSALTQEFAVIQGPPGTGKTFIGLKLVETLLKNGLTEQAGPILVICNTNHALDQFLEGILSFTDDIVRIGGQSKSPRMQEFLIKKWEEAGQPMRSSANSIVLTKMRKKLGYEMHGIKEQLQHYQESLFILQRGYGLLSSKTLDDMQIVDEETHPIMQKFFHWLKLAGRSANQLECQSLQYQFQELAKLRPFAPKEKPVLKLMEQQQEEHYEDDEEAVEDAQAFQLTQCVEDNDLELVVDVEDKLDEASGTYLRVEFEMLLENKQKKHVAVLNHTRACNQLKLFKHIQPLLKIDLCSIPPKPKLLLNKLDKQSLKEFSLQVYLEFVAFWHGQVIVWILDELMKKSKLYLKLMEKLRELQGIMQLHAIKEAKVIGMTTSGAAKYQSLLQNIGAKIVIVEEAAAVMEAHIVTSLPHSCQQLILIGNFNEIYNASDYEILESPKKMKWAPIKDPVTSLDDNLKSHKWVKLHWAIKGETAQWDHQQLKPNPTWYEMAKKYHLDVSMFEHAVNNGTHLKQLRVQHRMRPAISWLIAPVIYPVLVNHDSVMDYPSISGISQNVFFVTHGHEEVEEEDVSGHKNLFEAEFLLALCQRLLHQDIYTPDDITILTVYKGQLFAFKQLLKGNQFEDCKQVRCTVVDNFQGEENKIILLSLVRSNKEANIGFLKTENRLIAEKPAKERFPVVTHAQICVETYAQESVRSWSHTVEVLYPAVGTLSRCCQIVNTFALASVGNAGVADSIKNAVTNVAIL